MVQALVVSMIGVLLLVFHHVVSALVVCTLAMCLFIIGFGAPSAFAVIDRLAKRFGALVGTALTWILLVPFYYGVFTGGRLVLWVTGKDPLRRRKRPGETSYWVPHRGRPDAQQYEKQF